MSTLHDILRGIVGAIDHFSEKARDDLLAQIGEHETASIMPPDPQQASAGTSPAATTREPASTQASASDGATGEGAPDGA